MPNPIIYVIAGSNGAGKTTFAREFLPFYAKCTRFVNADLIAQGISPFAPEMAAMKAGRIVLAELHELVEQRLDFAFETTLSGKTYVRFLRDAKEKGYEIQIFFLWIPSVHLSISRIKQWVKQGGHNVPTADVRRRFKKSEINFLHYYKPLAQKWYFFDNSGIVPLPISAYNDGKIEIYDTKLYNVFFK